MSEQSQLFDFSKYKDFNEYGSNKNYLIYQKKNGTYVLYNQHSRSEVRLILIKNTKT